MRHETERMNHKAIEQSWMFSTMELQQRAALFIGLASMPNLHKGETDIRFDTHFAVVSTMALVKRLRALGAIQDERERMAL